MKLTEVTVTSALTGRGEPDASYLFVINVRVYRCKSAAQYSMFARWKSFDCAHDFSYGDHVKQCRKREK